MPSWLQEFQLRRQGKHGFAARPQGGHSQSCCGESPRVFGQRVPTVDCEMPTSTPAAIPLVELSEELVSFAAAQPCRERSIMGVNRTGLTLLMPPFQILIHICSLWLLGLPCTLQGLLKSHLLRSTALAYAWLFAILSFRDN